MIARALVALMALWWVGSASAGDLAEGADLQDPAADQDLVVADDDDEVRDDDSADDDSADDGWLDHLRPPDEGEGSGCQCRVASATRGTAAAWLGLLAALAVRRRGSA